MKILVAGDFVAQNRISDLFKSNNYEFLSHKIKKTISDSDYSIVNLEAPIVTDQSAKIRKVGPNLKMGEFIIPALKHAGFKSVTLANNHLRDYGDSNVIKTIELLNNNGIQTFGAGNNITEASQNKILNINDNRLAVINCCEHEYSIADSSHAGANPISAIAQYYAIQEAKKKSDYILVIVHGGVEMYNLPTPRMKELYRFYIDAGADAVVNHHQHCYSGYEVYRNKPIFYGLGNFCFDWAGRQNGLWVKGYMVEIEFSKEISFEIIPYIQCSDIALVRELNEYEYSEFDNNIKNINSTIKSDEKLQEDYHHYLDETRRSYKAILSPYSNRILQSLYIRNLLPGFMSKSKFHSIKNNIECESHRERLLDMIYKSL